MAVGPNDLEKAAEELAAADREAVTRVLEEEIDRFLITRGEDTLKVYSGVHIYDPAKLLSKRLPHIEGMAMLIGDIFNKDLKTKYQAAGWNAKYLESGIAQHDSIECRGCHEPARIIFTKKKE